MGHPKTFYWQQIKKYLRSNPGRSVTFCQTGELIGNHKQAATGARATNGCRATGLFPCDMNICRQHVFLSASGNINAALLNHPTLVKTSDQAGTKSKSSWCNSK
jgi:hypothetical protein